MGTCPRCQTEYPDGVTTCEKDGAELVDPAVMAAADREIEPGEQIGGYRVEAKLGQGGFGAVYRVVHPLIGKTAAIKVLSRRFSSDPDMVSRFVAEARAVNRIQNRNIIDIFAFGALPDGRQYYVMELLDGMTLEHYLARRHYLSPEEAIPILLGIARAVDAAHAAGIAHRDLKPDNVFLAFDEDRGVWPKLLDFGIAKLMDDVGGEPRTRTGAPLGTPYYMSPEQCRGVSLDHRTDIYSFGVLCYQLLSGKLPFTGESFMDVMMKHVGEEPPPVSSRLEVLSAAFDAPIAHMMAKNPDQRPASMLEALTELAEAARGAGHSVELPVKSSLGNSGARAPLHPELSLSEFVALESADTLAQATTATGDTLRQAAADTTRRRGWPLAVGGGVVLAAALAFVLPALYRRAPAEAASASAWASLPAPAPSATAPAAPIPPAASTPPIAPAPPAQIKLSVQSVPRHVEVYLGHKKLGTAPGPLVLERGKQPLQLELRADGYVPRKVKFTPTANGVLSATLQKIVHHARAPRQSKPKTPSDLEF